MQQHSLNATNSLNHLGAKHRGAMSTHKIAVWTGTGVCWAPILMQPVGTCDKGLPCFSKSRWPHFCRMIPSGSCTRRAVWYEATWETPNAADTINTRKTGTAQGRVAEFWERALDELNQSQVRIDHTVIRRGEEGIDQYFIDYNLTKAFEEYKGRFPKLWSERRLLVPPTLICVPSQQEWVMWTCALGHSP